ncbi:MAG: cell surface protein SprA [Flavobacteriales bacterium]|nr:cell surface protein SprA [Flavobacteriales bacterium]
MVQAQDDVKPLPYPKMGFKLPENFGETVNYRVDKGDFTFQKTIGSLAQDRPRFMSESAYRQWMFNQQIQSYWKEKAQSNLIDEGVAGTKPKFQMGESLGRVFGGNTIDIRPQGSAQLTFSGNFDKTKNPNLTKNQQSQGSFNFDQSIQMNVIGKIGTKLALRTNYDTKSQFDFENQMKLEYTGDEDQIIKKIELGNVSLPLSGSLISGTQSLFGVKAQFQFGKATFTTVFSEQKSETSTIRVDGGAQTTNFEIYADDYEANKHFFLGQYFYDNYDGALRNMPVISSSVSITNVEVWVTNRSGVTQNVRNVLAFQDLGEQINKVHNKSNVYAGSINIPTPDNKNNSLDPQILVNDFQDIRNVSRITSSLNGTGYEQSVDYEKIENAKKLTRSEYSFDPQLGFISLNQALNSDEILAVAFQYTYNGEPYQVGELSTDVASPDALVLKLLKSTSVDVELPLWNLSMKNVYALGAYQVNKEDFNLQINYQDDESGTPLPFLPEEGLSSSLLIQLMNLDNLNQNNDPGPDGVFDFIPNLTIKTSNGRVYLPSTEPFGDHLRSKFTELGLSSDLADRYVFDALYDSTKTAASQVAELNKFIIKGQYKSSSGSDIPLNAMDVPQGSVTVSMGGAPLEENVHYTVDYNLGRVKIIDEGILSSGQQIDVKLESNSAYSWMTKRYLGLHADYKFNDDFIIGATLLNLSENSQTPKINMGEEPISNTIWGINGSYKTEAPLLTRLVDKLPLIETKEKSTLLLTGEFAQFIPGHPKSINIDETGTAYIDDFENSQSPIDLRTAHAWNLASTPQDKDLFPESTRTNDLSYGYNRALLSWYTINSDLQRKTSYSPRHISDEDREAPYVREISINEIFPDKDIPHGQPLRLRTFDLAFYPSERGPYNFDVKGDAGISNGIDASGALKVPESRWGGVVRELQTNDFESANVEFIEFWMMDPFIENPSSSGGDFYINLGNVSEDILKDSRKSYENGLPIDGDEGDVDTTAWGRVPSVQALVNAFNSGQTARDLQDVGLDGLSDEQERAFISVEGGQTETYLEKIQTHLGLNSEAYNKANQDPSADNYHYYYGEDYNNEEKSILERYKRYNGLDGNSLIPNDNDLKQPYSQLPDVEDINSDYTLSESESYFQYKVSMRPEDLGKVGNNYITSIIDNAGPNNNTRWIQFKIPVRSYDKKTGSIPDFKSIRFMRMFMKGFESTTVLRFASLDLVRGEWRKYLNSLIEPGTPIENEDTGFDISVVNLEENGRRDPVRYVLPPGIERERILGSTTTQQQNEQSISFKICDLQNGDARGAFKNVTMDMRMYNKMKFFVHAEEMPMEELNDEDLSMFIRVGTDYNSNYYEYEIPLKVTEWGASSRDQVWPEENQVEIDFDLLRKAKLNRNAEIREGNPNVNFNKPYSYQSTGDKKRINIVGNPNLANVRTIMLGVRNPKSDFHAGDDGLPKCVEVWINELRLTDFDERGGYAAKAQLKTRLADLGSMTLAGNMSTVGFGSLEQGVTERNQEETRQYNFTSNVELGKLFSEEANVKIPVFVGVSETVLSPQFNPLDPDVELKATLADERMTEGARDTLRSVVENYTLRRSINLTNVRKERSRGGAKEKKSKKERSSKNRLYDIENISLSYSFNEIFNRNINTEFSVKREHSGGLGYNFNNSPKNYKPFSKIKFLRKSKYFRLIKDFNFYLLPKSISARADFNKSYAETKMRNLAALNTTMPMQMPEPDTLFSKLFNMTQSYNVKHDFARSLKLNFSANRRAIVDEPEGRIDSKSKREALRDSILTFGRTTSYHHQFDLRYTVPINKLPLTDWINLTLNYSGTYDWDAGSIAMINDSINLGNVIQNTNKKRINAQFKMSSLYNKVPYFKNLGKNSNKRRSDKKKKEDASKSKGSKGKSEKDTDAEDEESEKRRFNPLTHIAQTVLSVKNVSLTYDETNGTMIPGFMPSTGFLGMEQRFKPNSAPGLGFLLGEQPSSSDMASFASKGWITADTLLNQQLTQQYTSRLNIRSKVEPIKKLKIQVTAQRSQTRNESEIYKNTGDFDNPFFESLNKNESGSFTMSFLAIGTAFRPMNMNSSKTFDEMRAMRAAMAKEVAKDKGIAYSPSDPYPVGVGPNSQDVLIPAFLAAYSGKGVSSQTRNKFPSIPLPNWKVKYNGLSDIPWVKKRFKTVTLSHGYTSTYSISSYQTNLFYTALDKPNTGTPDSNPENFDVNGNYLTKYQIQTVNISEQFNPLIKVDITMNNSLTTRFEISKDRQVSLSLNNNQIQEQVGRTLTLGVGYRVSEFELSLPSAKGRKTYSSNLDVNLDVSVRKTASAIRSIEENTHQSVSGSTDISIKTSADYVMSERINLQLFYDRMVRKYEVANAYDTANSSFGIKLRFSFGR